MTNSQSRMTLKTNLSNRHNQQYVPPAIPLERSEQATSQPSWRTESNLRAIGPFLLNRNPRIIASHQKVPGRSVSVRVSWCLDYKFYLRQAPKGRSSRSGMSLAARSLVKKTHCDSFIASRYIWPFLYSTKSFKFIQNKHASVCKFGLNYWRNNTWGQNLGRKIMEIWRQLPLWSQIFLPNR